MAKNVSKKKPVGIILISVIAALVLLLALLRCFHIIVRVGGSYKLCFSTEYRVDGDMEVNDDSISEINYLRNLKHFSAFYTGLTNIDFASDLTKLESLSVMGDPDVPESIIKSMPSLEKLSDLDYLYLYYVDVQNLDFLSNCTGLENITVVTHGTEITDLSGLDNKPKLKYVYLDNVDCTDYSVLLRLPALEYLVIDGSKLPDEVKNELLNKNVKIKERGSADR
ncbi:MAG: hypothetical protein IJ170_06950 [Ruminococcus sp.]|nr:hypothetical protein [Ruminococcus sp.]